MVTFEPEVAVAIARCVTSRSLADRARKTVDVDHPRACGWCDYPVDELVRSITGFNEWAGWNETKRTYERHDVRVFAELPRERQRELVLVAQAFEPDAIVPLAPDPAEDASWL